MHRRSPAVASHARASATRGFCSAAANSESTAAVTESESIQENEQTLSETIERLLTANRLGAPPPTDAAKALVETFLRLCGCNWDEKLPPGKLDSLLSALCFLGKTKSLPDSNDESVADLWRVASDLKDHGSAAKLHDSLRRVRSPLSVAVDGVMGGVGAGAGVPFLLDLRGAALRFRKARSDRLLDTSLVVGQRVSDDEARLYLDRLLDVLNDAARRWLDPALLAVQRVSFASAPAYELNAIRNADRVHPVADITALRQRFEDGKACFALYHRLWRPGSESNSQTSLGRCGSQPAFSLSGTRGLPLVNIMAAYASSIPGSMVEVDACNSATERDGTVACFYSINAMQEGAAGLRLGQLLINRAVQICVRDSAHAVRRGERRSALATFVTLSPLPGFAHWLRELLIDGGGLEIGVLEQSTARTLCTQILPTSTVPQDDEVNPMAARILYNALFGKSKWYEDASLTEAFRAPLLELADRYIVHSTKNNRTVDPVANFHIGNGAVLHRLNWMADATPLRLQQSFGIMANYLYDPSALVLEQQAIAYSNLGIVCRSRL